MFSCLKKRYLEKWSWTFAFLLEIQKAQNREKQYCGTKAGKQSMTDRLGRQVWCAHYKIPRHVQHLQWASQENFRRFSTGKPKPYTSLRRGKCKKTVTLSFFYCVLSFQFIEWTYFTIFPWLNLALQNLFPPIFNKCETLILFALVLTNSLLGAERT